MKARIIATGEIKSFYPTRQSGCDGYVDSEGQWYYPSELDFRNEGKPIPTSEYLIGSVWIARNQDGSLVSFFEKPVRYKDHWIGNYFRELRKRGFPQITWLSQPMECEVNIKIK